MHPNVGSVLRAVALYQTLIHWQTLLRHAVTGLLFQKITAAVVDNWT